MANALLKLKRFMQCMILHEAYIKTTAAHEYQTIVNLSGKLLAKISDLAKQSQHKILLQINYGNKLVVKYFRNAKQYDEYFFAFQNYAQEPTEYFYKNIFL